MNIQKEFRFEASHILSLPYESDCNRLHGHSYKVIVYLEGDVDALGMVHDYTKMPKTLIEDADHMFICPRKFISGISGGQATIFVNNENGGHTLSIPVDELYIIEGNQSTAENLARHFYKVLKEKTSISDVLAGVSVKETEKTQATYMGEDDA